MSAPALLTEQQAAEALQVCSRTLRKARQDGQLNFVQIGRNIRYSESDLEHFIERNRVCPSISAKARHTGNTRSRSTVLDFEAALAKQAREKPPE